MSHQSFLYPYTTTKTSHIIKLKVNNTTTLLYLKGIVYYGDNHFTSRIISKDGRIWFKDGITTRGQSIEEGHLSTMTDKNPILYPPPHSLVGLHWIPLDFQWLQVHFLTFLYFIYLFTYLFHFFGNNSLTKYIYILYIVLYLYCTANSI